MWNRSSGDVKPAFQSRIQTEIPNPKTYPVVTGADGNGIPQAQEPEHQRNAARAVNINRNSLIIAFFVIVILANLFMLTYVGYDKLIREPMMITGQWGLSQQGITSFIILETNMTEDIIARQRVFYEDGTPINLTISKRYIDSNITVNFSPIDSEYDDGDEQISAGPSGTYYAYYWIGASNTRDNGRYEITVTDHTYNDTLHINMSLHNGAFPYGFISSAADCSIGLDSDYFQEKDECPDQAWDGNKVVLRYVDVDFSFGKFSSPWSIEKLCSDNSDDRDGDGRMDCADNDCASIVYGCSNTTLGWRDDPLGPPFENINCNFTTNLCYTNVSSTTLTHITYTYNMGPGGYFAVRYEQGSEVQGKSVYFAEANLNESLDITDASFSVINYSQNTGLHNMYTATTETAVRAQTGPPGNRTNFTGDYLDMVYLVKIPSNTTARGNQTPRIVRLISPEPSGIRDLLFNITDDGMVYEHDISCRDGVDNDLFYDTDCTDPDCDGYVGKYPDDPCCYGNESTYADTNNTCMDSFDNDADGTQDCRWSGYDTDCDGVNIINASEDTYNIGGAIGLCELLTEDNCSDGFDNDRDRAFDCVTKEISNGIDYDLAIDYSSNPVNPLCNVSNAYTLNNDSHPDAEYSCAGYCQAEVTGTESGVNGCLDGKDNDLDFYNQGTCTQNTSGGGVDCRMIEYDLDCNGTQMTDGNGRSGNCQIVFERNCSDGFDNDRDGRYDCAVSDAGADGIPEYRFNSDMDGDYDCHGRCVGENASEDTSAECQDNKDNDIDYWNITGFTTDYSATQNPLGGMDCRYDYDGLHPADPDCEGVTVTDSNGVSGPCALYTEQDYPSDSMDNDMDINRNAGANRLLGVGGADCDDYDAAGTENCTTIETYNVTGGIFHYSNNTPYDVWCFDGIDNDLDRFYYQNASGSPVNSSGGIDCIYNFNGIRPAGMIEYINASEANQTYDDYLADPDCNNTPAGNVSTGYALCQLHVEKNCSDGFDNDQDYYVSELRANVGSDVRTANWSANPVSYDAYFSTAFVTAGDCDDYSCKGASNCPDVESIGLCDYGSCGAGENWCLDGIDNDLDKYATDGISTGTDGVDCRWSGFDSDCNNTLFKDTVHGSSIGLCTLKWEYNCSDGVDNDQDLGVYYDAGSPAGSASAGADTGVDCDDYNCFGSPSCVHNETNCSDGIDNDLDKYFWNATAGTYQLNLTGGIDCGDPDCDGKTGPSGFACAFEELMEGFNPYTLCGDYNTGGYSFDNDGDVYANCHDDGCYHEGICRVCPAVENITVDSCADGLDNELEFEAIDLAKLLYYGGQTQYSTDGKDCSDSDCANLVGDINSDGVADGICTGTGGLVSEAVCNDNLDNDLDGSTDCEDANCNSAANCLVSYPTSVGTCTSGWNCTNDNKVRSTIDFLPMLKYNADWGSMSTDLIYTEVQYQGQSISFNFYNYDQYGGEYVVNDNIVVLYIGTSTNPLPSQYNVSSANVFVSGIQAENFTVTYPADGLALQFNDGITNSYPDQPLNVTVTIELDDSVIVPLGSTYTFGINYNVAGQTSSGSLATQFALETETPVAVWVKPISNQRINRTRLSDTIEVYANATDIGAGLFNSGIDYCQFYNGSTWVNENSISGTSKGDCKHNLVISDGTHELRARAVDGVGNVGIYTNMTVTVVTVPRQLTLLYCSGQGCSVKYPVKDHLNVSESVGVMINFTSEAAGFTSNATGCVVYAETESGSSTLGSVSLTSVGNVAVCNGSLPVNALLNDNYYRLSVKVIDNDGEVAISGENPYDDGYLKQGLWVCNNVQMSTGYACTDECEETPTTTVILYSPVNDSINYTRRTNFVWYGINQSYTYHLQVDDDPGFFSKEINQYEIADTSSALSNFTPSFDLDVDTLYYWRVRAFDGLLYGNWSVVWQYTLQSMRSIFLQRDTVDFGTLNRTQTANTSYDDPLPFLFENDGNIVANVTVNATSFFTSVPYPSVFYQYAIGVNESNAFLTQLSTMDYVNMSGVNQDIDVFGLQWEDVNDTGEVDLLVSVPENEPAGPKTSQVILTTS